MKRRNFVASVTEIQSFQSCKRRWYLGRQYSEETDQPGFFLGSLVHAGLEGYYKGCKAGTGFAVQNLWVYFNRYVEEGYARMQEGYGEYWDSARSAYDGIVEVGRRMLENYLEFEQHADVQFKRIITAERRFYTPLGGGNFLSAKIDLIAHDGMFYRIVDHKTSKGLANTGKALDIDEQLTGYTYCVWKGTGRIMEPTYNVLLKKAPEMPRILKNGYPSKAKGQSTTYEMLLQAVEATGADPDDYYEVLEHLQASGWNDYFYREGSPRNEHQLLSYEWRTRLIFEEMRDILEDPKLAYPSPNGFKCQRCPFLSVCNAMEDGSQYQALLDSSFIRTTTDPYKTPERQKESKPSPSPSIVSSR